MKNVFSERATQVFPTVSYLGLIFEATFVKVKSWDTCMICRQLLKETEFLNMTYFVSFQDLVTGETRKIFYLVHGSHQIQPLGIVLIPGAGFINFLSIKSIN